jgi:hypothetical protein
LNGNTAAAAAGGVVRPCLLVNPRSFRANWFGLARHAAELAGAAGIEVRQVTTPPSLRVVLDELRQRGQQQVWMLTGDGTLHALAEYLADLPEGQWTPQLLFLAGGRANVVPRECGGYPAMPALKRALAAHVAGRALEQRELHTLRVVQQGQPVRHGFLLAGAMIYEGVRACAENHRRGEGWLHNSFFADPLVLLGIGLQVLAGRSPLPPCPLVTTRLPGIGELTAPLRVLVAATLEMHSAIYNPFAARGTGPLRLTAVAASATSFWRNLPAMTWGRFRQDMDTAHGYLSGRADRAELLGISGYALDGELFAADPALPLELSTGPVLRVLRP